MQSLDPVQSAVATAGAVREVIPRTRGELLNRAVNVLVAGTALVVLLPLLVVVGLAVKLTSPGPIFYRQTRVGEDRRWRYRGAPALYDRRARDFGGRVFTIYKFRSMRTDAEARSGAVWAAADDPRITRVGRIIRKLRIDELPQLLNVVLGDMNIVGPRPERPGIVAQLWRTIPEYQMRQRARPGITGWAQINHAYDASIEDVRTKVRYDLEYLERQSLGVDLAIMLKTLPVMIFRRGAL